MTNYYTKLDQLAADLDRVKTQLHAVANTPQMQRTSVDAGAVDFNDEDGNLKAIMGLQFDGGTTMNVVNGPTPPTPAGFTVEVDNGRITAKWDGSFVDGAIAPTDWSRVQAYVKEGQFVTADPQYARGSIVSAAGGETVVGVLRGTYTVCLAAWSQAGKQSAMSAPITVEVPGFGDLVQQAIDAAEALIDEAKATLDAGQAELTTKLAELKIDVNDLGYDIDVVEAAQSAMEGEITAAQQKADDAFQNAATADSNAATAKSVADQAKADAAAAAGVAGGKADVLIQSTAPATAMRKATTLWIDTTSSANTPKRWNGTAWVAVTDKAATDAAAAATAAQTKADQAKTAADQAKATADAAQTAASNAQATATQALTSANSKNTITRSTANPPASYTGRVDDLWWKMTTLAAGGRVLSQSRWTGTAWLEEQIDSAVLAYVDAAKITTGFLDVATLIKAAAITVDKLLIGDFSNVHIDPTFANPAAAVGSWTVVNNALEKNGTGSQNGAYANYTEMACQPGEKFYVEMTRETLAGTVLGEVTMYVQQYRTGTSTWGTPIKAVAMTTDGRSTGTFTTSSDATKIRFGYYTQSNVPAATRVRISNPMVRRMVGGTLIEPGGIQTPHLAADVLEVKNFKAGTGQMNEAVIAKLFSDVVVARMSQAQEFIGENAILTESITAPKITASDELTAKIAKFLTVRAEMMDADAINGMVITAPTIQSATEGRRWVADIDSIRILDDSDDVRTMLSPEGSVFKGEVEADTLVVNGGAELRGVENTISQGSKLTIAAGVTDPTAAPTVQMFWDNLELDDSSFVARGLGFDGTNYWTADANMWATNDVGRFIRIDGTSGVVTEFDESAAIPSFNELYGVTCIGSELFWFWRKAYTAKVTVTNLSCVKIREWDYTEYLGYTKDNPLGYKPGIGTDGTNVIIAQCNDTGFLNIRTFNKTSGALISRVYDANDKTKSDVSGVYVGTADLGGSTKYAAIVKSSADNVPWFNASTGVYDSSKTFPLAMAGDAGLSFNNGSFHTVSSEGFVNHYQSKDWGDGASDWWASYSWASFDDDADNNIDRWSRMSPGKKFTWQRRAKVKVLGQPLPATVGFIQPALAKKSTTPVRTDFHSPPWEVTLNKSVAWWNIWPTDWASKPSPGSTNNYPSVTPAEIASSSSTFSVKGDGSGRWGKLGVAANGDLTGVPRVATGGGVSFPTVAANGGSETVNITFPSGRFTDVPSVAAMTSHGRVTPVVFNITKTGFSFRVWNFTTGSASSCVGSWQAIQET